MVMGGALADLSGATCIFKNKQDAEAFISEDPYVKNGIVTDSSMAEWSVVDLWNYTEDSHHINMILVKPKKIFDAMTQTHAIY